ncbi:MAG: efflux transporter periplasmic adaptor subunit [Candidatus Cloacimonadota bacterium]|nr:MAG: efflux transporter periplasmic adaptor subunit [Candidatus Cloacimonadota bacterium]PIE77452.1 MAG: efflux transporter periplasmic adaptor subunit [Candidatus Delongbacteria bacterium]
MRPQISKMIILTILSLSIFAHAEERVKVYAEKVKLISYNENLESSGTIFANKEANLGAAIPGRIEKINIEEGEFVKKGELIAQLSDETLIMQGIEYKTLQKDFERSKRLFKKGSLPEQKFDHVKAKYEASKERYNLIKKNTEIRAPFSGIVVEHMLNEGETFLLINPGLIPGYSHANGIVRLMQLSPIKTVIEINEKDIERVKEGFSATIDLDAYKNQVFTGKVSRIYDMLNPATHTIKVEILIKNEDRKLKPGMFGHVTLELDEKEGMFIPSNSIIHQSGTGQYYVYKLENNIAKRVDIKKISTKDDLTCITGLNKGDIVVTGGKYKIKDGTKVEVINK